MTQPAKVSAVSKNTVFSVAKRHSLPNHEKMLLEIRDYLPGLLVDELQSADPLNERLRASSLDWTKRIESLIAEKNIDGAEAKIWRQVPKLRFSNPTLPHPTTALGVTLTKRVDSPRNGRSLAPILVSDFALNLKIPRWHWLYLRDDKGASFPENRVTKPTDCVNIHQQSTDVEVYGQVFPTECKLGEVAVEMARLIDAVSQHAEDRYGNSHHHRHVLLVTDSETIFGAFSGQYDAVLFPQEEDSVSWRFGHLQALHTCVA